MTLTGTITALHNINNKNILLPLVCLCAGLLTSGLLPVVRHALDHLMALSHTIAVTGKYCCPWFVLCAGLLTSGLLPDVRHALDHLMVREQALVIPASARVMVQAVQVATPPVCGLDLTALDRHR